MPIIINLRHLDEQNVRLEGDLPAQELDIEARDDIIQLRDPLRYDLEIQELEDGLLVQGWLSLDLECRCVRCLKPCKETIRLDPWTLHLPLQGEEAVPVVNDCVDLTPLAREDILLEFPQHPLCDAGCGGLPNTQVGKANDSNSVGRLEAGLPAWKELNKLKF